MKINKIKSFIEGNYLYYKDLLFSSPEYIKEQVYYRLYLCKDDCLVRNACIYCECPPNKKSWVAQSCNEGKRFPDIKNKPDWEKFKQENNIDINKIMNND